MAEIYQQKGPALSASFARMAEPKPVDISRSLNLIDKFTGAFAGTAVKADTLAQAKADGDFLRNTINPEDMRDDAIYTRTVRQRENSKWFEAKAQEIEEAKSNPSHPMAQMSDKEFAVHYQESINARIKTLAEDSGTANTQNDFVEFMAEHGPKLQANHAVLRRAVNQEKIITETTLAVSDALLSKDQTVENLDKILIKLPGLAVIPDKARINLLMTASTMAAGQGNRVGIDYMQKLQSQYPELEQHIRAAESVYMKRKMEDNNAKLFSTRVSIEAETDAGLFDEKKAQRIQADPLNNAEFSDEYLMGRINQSKKNRAELDAMNSITSSIRNGGSLNCSETDLNKGLNHLWHETLEKNGGNFRAAIPEYTQIVGHVGKFGSDFTGTIKRALSSGFEATPDGMPPNDWAGAMLIAGTLSSSGNADQLELSDDLSLAAELALLTFETHTSRDGSLAPVNEAMQAAYDTFSRFKKRKAEGTLPEYITDKFRFKQLVTEKLKDKTKVSRWAGDWLPFFKADGAYDSVNSEIQERLYDTAYMLAVNNNYADVDKLLDVAFGKIKKDYVVVGRKLQRDSKVPLHNAMGIDKKELPAVEKEFISSAFIKENFPDHDDSDLNIDILSVGADAAFVVSSLKDSNLPSIQVPASHLGTIYKEALSKRRANELAKQHDELPAKRIAADRAKKEIVHDFSRSLQPLGSRADMVPESFKKLYYNQDDAMKAELATAWINAHDKAAEQDMRITLKMIRDSVKTVGGVTVIWPFNEEVKKGRAAKEAWRKEVQNRRNEFVALTLRAEGADTTKQITSLAKTLGVSEAAVSAGLNNRVGKAQVRDMAKVLTDPVAQDALNELLPGIVTRELITGVERKMNADVKSNKGKFKIPEAVHSFVDKTNPVGRDSYDHLRESKFLDAYSAVAVNEGKYGWDTNGAQVFMGINRKSWPNWSLWKTVDAVIKNNNVYKTTTQKEQALDRMADDPLIRTKVAEFYHKNFYKPLQLDKIKDTALRVTIMDLGVRGGVDTYNKVLRQTIKDLGGSTEVNTQPLSQGHINFINKNSAAFYNVFFNRSDEYTSGLNVPEAARQAWQGRNAMIK